ncbi:MAG: alpha/beta hydrolase [Acidimicrobiales bacterium]|nr:alpha/beta hydrolase [Acidimicrobiales bacterium]
MKIYLDYDQTELDAEYDLRPLVPNHLEIFTRYIRDGQSTTSRQEMVRDITYGQNPKQTLDLFPAAPRHGLAPVVCFIHGGYWRNKDKSDFHYLAPAFTRAGVHFVLINYTLAPEASMDQIVQENREAVVWLAAHAAEHGIDPKRIHVTGHSAGGHLVAMLMVTDWSSFAGGQLGSDVLAGGTAISGLFDLEPIRLCYLNESLHLDDEQALRNSPVGLTPTTKTPLILALGGDETSEYHRQQEALLGSWSKHDLPLSIVEMPGLNHYDVIDHLGHPGSALHHAVIDQVRGSKDRSTS